MTPNKPIDWIYTHRNSQYWVCAFYDRQIQIFSLTDHDDQ